ncbi:hypothetical protein L6164_004058 [Bauhinia variegata]|uniref:Uncharacterized protein n=1 Tax=Bauhinia variegata TaxID=167791 RepID=A0ACB9Q367_BAUVA|nr:hypothetical protein L6164_004058 [Bauhinia variegata]
MNLKKNSQPQRPYDANFSSSYKTQHNFILKNHFCNHPNSQNLKRIQYSKLNQVGFRIIDDYLLWKLFGEKKNKKEKKKEGKKKKSKGVWGWLRRERKSAVEN